MVARYYGHELDYRALTAMAGVSRYGSNLLELARAGENLGFVTTGIQTTWDMLAHVDLPAIAHLADRHHFVVVWRTTRRSVVVGDPSFATRTLSREEFTKSWQGMLLLLKPTDRVATNAKALAPVAGRSHTGSLASLVLPYRKVLVEILLISLGLQILGLAFPLGSQVVVDRVLLRADVKLLDVALLALVGAAAVSGVLAYARAYLILQTATRIERDVVETIYRRVMAGVSGLFQRFTTTDILNRFLEVSLIRTFFIDNAVTISIDLLMIACTGGLLFLYSPPLALVALATVPIQAALTVLVGKLIGSHTAAFLNHHDDYQTHLMDSFKGFEMVKAHGLEIPFTRTMQRLVAPTLQHSFQATLHGSMGAATSFAVDMIGSALVLWVGARQVLAGSMTLGTLVAFTLLARQVGTPILRMASQWRDYQRTRANIDRVGSLLEVDGEGTKRSTAVVDLPAIQGNVRFRGVLFRYGTKPQERPTLSRIDLELAAGEIVALVGPSGCGKSTLVRLLLRLHDPTEGTVSIDGYNLRDVTPESVRSQVGLVTQDIQLVSGTIYENIACGRAVSEEAVMDAARLAGAYEFISELPYGFLTLVGERGLSLSGGQRQRIVIARALVTNPRVLIFDEATAALDPLSEQLIHERLREIVRGRTTIIISHRIQTLQHADRIIVMNEGRIVQMGTHDALIAAGGKLYNALASATPDWKRAPEEVVDGVG
jgi:HlyB family type I secretion system ABC transporter